MDRTDMDRQEMSPEEEGREAETTENTETAGLTEADVLRDELRLQQEKNEVLRQTADDFQDKYLRSRAELENWRRRSAQDAERARSNGLDEALRSVFRVFDDLERAVNVASEGSEGAILPGVKLVLENLEAELARLGVERIGSAGEQFDPERHEAVTALPADEGNQPGTIAQVVQAGFSQGERLIRPAAVVVYND